MSHYLSSLEDGGLREAGYGSASSGTFFNSASAVLAGSRHYSGDPMCAKRQDFLSKTEKTFSRFLFFFDRQNDGFGDALNHPLSRGRGIVRPIVFAFRQAERLPNSFDTERLWPWLHHFQATGTSVWLVSKSKHAKDGPENHIELAIAAPGVY